MIGGLSRRAFLRALVVAGAAAATPRGVARAAAPHRAARNSRGGAPDYGPLRPVLDRATGLPLLELPEGFAYTSFGWTGDPLQGGTPTPAGHDGMAVFALDRRTFALIRNHEILADRGAFAESAPLYDRAASGGTTNLVFDAKAGALREARASLAGTLMNCAGGATPWGSWLTCEESVSGPAGWIASDEKPQAPHPRDTKPKLEREHGYVFEVPVRGAANAEPLRALGRFVHEAVAIDPATGVLYLTEDRDPGGLYRFVPSVPGELARGGRLEMLAVTEHPGIDLAHGQPQGASYTVHWVPIPEADPPGGAPDAVFRQGFARGGASFRRLEGAAWGHARLWFSSTIGGDAWQGQLWSLDPARSTLALVYESKHAAFLNQPDNLTVTPRGGLLVAEDGDGTEFLHALTPDGRLFRFAQNRIVLTGQRNDLFGDFTGGEFTGPCFSSDGEWLFVNVQEPGVTFAITGPWKRGPL